MLYVGTAGYSYSDWVGALYPEGMKQSDFLSFYATKFNSVEVDYTYYRQPSARTMEGMVRKVGPDFRFTVKAHKTITHEIPEAESDRSKEIQTFTDGVAPMVESGTLGCILFQFPWGFKYSPANLDYVVSLGDKLPSAPAVVEFRNAGWARDDVYQALRGSGTGFCCVDEPNLKGLFPKVVQVTSKVAYLRFHGRNAAKWWSHKEAWERYDYLYTDDEMKPWIPKIRDMEDLADDTYVLFNNCHRGQAATNASRMKELLQLL
ncbi:MAG: DUF72 domain-containing protein [Bacillota bacterium]